MELPDRSQARSWEGKEVVDRDGARLGRCVGVFADTATGVPEWLHVDVEGHVRSFVPALEAAESDGTVRVRFARAAVLGAPAVGDDEQLSKAEEVELYRHYGVPVEGEGSVLPASDATADAAAGASGDARATAATGAATAGAATAAAATAPVVGTSDRTSTAAASSSGADTSVAETDADVDGRLGDRAAGTTALPLGGGADAGTSALSDASTASGGVVTPETGEQLPVLDPAAASTPVPEEQVTYVDEPEVPVGDADEPVADAPAAAAAEQPRPTLRRVPPASPPPASPAPAPAPAASSSGGGDLSALTPLGAVAGVAAAVALVLRARERRERRRNSAAARAGRLGSSLRASAGTTLAGVSEAAELTRRSAVTASEQAARAAAKQQQRAAAATRRSRTQTASALTTAAQAATRQKKAAAKSAAQQRKAAHASIEAASRTARQQRKAAKASLRAAAKTAAQQRAAARASLASATSRSSSTADSVVAVPRKVAKKGRKVRRSLARKLWQSVLLATAGGGYVMGAKAGRERYDELAQVAAAVAGSPQVQAATEAVKDPERRTDLLVGVQQQVSSLVGRRGEPRN